MNVHTTHVEDTNLDLLKGEFEMAVVLNATSKRVEAKPA